MKGRILAAMPKGKRAKSRKASALDVGKERLAHGTPSPTVLYLRTLGVIGVAFGLAGLIATQFFRAAAVLFYLGFLLWGIDLLVERTLGLKTKLILGCFIAALPILFTHEIILFSADVDVSSYWNEANLPIGSDVDGIKWDQGMSELIVSFHNPTDRDYDGFELTMQPSDVARDMKEVTDIPCTEIQNVITGIYSKNEVFRPMTKLGPYRYRCDELPENSTIQFILAISNGEQLFSDSLAGKPPPTNLPFGFWGAKRKPN